MAKKPNTSMEVIKHMNMLLNNTTVAKCIAANGNVLNSAMYNQLEFILNSDGTYRKVKSARLVIVADQLRLLVEVAGRDTASFVIRDNSRV